MPGGPEILLLGELGLSDRRPLPASKKTRALLGFLAVTGAPHTREELCDLLWQGPDDPRAALRWSLTKLRQVLGPDAIEADRERVSLGSGVATDLGAVRSALAAGIEQAPVERLLFARERFRGELLEGLLLPDCYRFHQWSTAERERARALRVAVLVELGERSRPEPEKALEWARERAAIDPLAEAAHVEVIRLLATLGRKRDALEQFESARRILEREVGARPSAALLEAKMKIGAPAVGSPAKSPVEPPPSRRPSAPPLVGRNGELELVARAARGELGRVLVVLGEPGIGKTRLLDELRARTRALGGTVLAGRAFEAETVRPYGPWVDALGAVDLARVPEALRDELGPLLPAQGATERAAQNRGSLFDAVSKLVVHLSASAGPVAIVVDDLQWCDEASLALLHYVARASGDARVAIACGARPGELEDNPAAVRLLRALARDGRSQSVELGPLDPDSLAALARSVAAKADVERVIRDSAGNPLFALELARATHVGRDSAWESLGGLIGERIARLDEPARELLAWAAAFGTRFELGTLERVTGTAPLEVSTRVAELERHGIVRASADGSAYDFAHDLVRAGAYRQLSEPRRRGVHQCIARTLSALDDSDSSRAGDVAHHAALGGDAALAARGALAAARRCLRMFAGSEAARLADFGMQQLDRLPRLEKLRYELAFLSVLVFSGAWSARIESIKRELTRVIASAQDAGLKAELVDGLQALSTLQYDGGDLGGAHGTTLRVVEAVRTADPLTRARQLGNSARCLAMLERDLDQAHAMIAEARELTQGEATRFAAIEWAAAILTAFGGDAEAATRDFEAVLELARAEGDPWAEYECLRALVQIEIESDAPPGRSGHASELLEAVAKMGDGSTVPVARALESLLALKRGEPGALEALEKAVSMLRDVDAKGMLAYTLTIAADADIESGRLNEAEKRAEEALAASSAVGRRTQTTLARTLLARVALGRGDSSLGQSHFDAAKRDLDEPLAVSARARSAVLRLTTAFGH
jgi:DNA-binding SARP family transcriptional activator